MKPEGPPLDTLTRRLAECPPSFLAAPRLSKGKGLVVEALVHDVLVDLGAAPAPWMDLAPFRGSRPEQAQRLRVIAVTCWLLAAPELRALAQQRELAPGAHTLLAKGLDALAHLVGPEALLSDPDRREELVRRVLDGLGLRPAGEAEAYATDRLSALDSVARDRVLQETRAQVEKARKLREAMAKRAAEEAAARYSGE